MTPAAPAPAWAALELVVAVAVIAAGLLDYIPFSSTPALLAVAAVFVWWRGPGWRGVGLRRPASMRRQLAIGLAVGAGYQFFGLYVLEPAIARMTSGELPDVSAFRSLIGNEALLVFWLAISWTLAAFLEEMVYRGWLMTRVRVDARRRFSSAGRMDRRPGRFVCVVRRGPSLSGCVGHDCHRPFRVRLRMRLPDERTESLGEHPCARIHGHRWICHDLFRYLYPG